MKNANFLQKNSCKNIYRNEQFNYKLTFVIYISNKHIQKNSLYILKIKLMTNTNGTFPNFSIYYILFIYLYAIAIY